MILFLLKNLFFTILGLQNVCRDVIDDVIVHYDDGRHSELKPLNPRFCRCTSYIPNVINSQYDECYKCSKNRWNTFYFNYQNLNDRGFSDSCSVLEQFRAYNFSKIRMISHFQNRNLSTERLSNDSHTNFLPSICLSKSLNSHGLFDIKIAFNNYQKVDYSSLFNRTTFSVKLFEVGFKNSSKYKGELMGIKQPILVLEKTFPQMSTFFEILNRRDAKYLMELYVNQKSPFCERENECVEETNYNNKFQCLKCNKLVTIFNLKKELNENIRKQTNENLEFSISNLLDSNLVQNEIFKCASNEIYSSMLEKTRTLRHSDANIPDLYSYIFPYDFNIESLQLPFDYIENKINAFPDFSIYLQIFGIVLLIVVILVVLYGFYLLIKKECKYQIHLN